eukprot:TRINITY_DN1004_c0_g1_i1.p1 TRINITY_DN1004_c0_g1~~TRINITY_DN1004_c0_g1_i1.p1  ORF type:complete len:179 (+),score=85.03 TRINITY_DN1004_c0_g1_i1:120-656(+)
MANKSVTVFCGSRFGTVPIFKEQAEQLGALIAQNGLRLVYGGGNGGLMGAVAQSTLDNGGQVIGITIQQFEDGGHSKKNLTQLTVVPSMHERKQLLYSNSDYVIILPGGLGTLDEFFETITWNQLNIHSKKLFILNTSGFYNDLISHINKCIEFGFLYGKATEQFQVLNEPSDFLKYI